MGARLGIEALEDRTVTSTLVVQPPATLLPPPEPSATLVLSPPAGAVDAGSAVDRPRAEHGDRDWERLLHDVRRLRPRLPETPENSGRLASRAQDGLSVLAGPSDFNPPPRPETSDSTLAANADEVRALTSDSTADNPHLDATSAAPAAENGAATLRAVRSPDVAPSQIPWPETRAIPSLSQSKSAAVADADDAWASPDYPWRALESSPSPARLPAQPSEPGKAEREPQAFALEREAVPAPVRKTVTAHADASDGSLLRRFVVDGDQTAFTTLVQRHERLVFNVCQRVLGDVHLAQDALQATFVVLARKASMLDGETSLGGWLYRVAFHLALRLQSVVSRHRRLETKAGTQRRSSAASAAADLEDQELREALSEELERLPAKYRMPLVLCYFDGQTHSEIARATGLPRGSVAKRIGKGLERLRERLLDRGIML